MYFKYTYLNTYICTCIYICTYIHIYLYTCTYMYIYTNIYTYLYIYIHNYTYLYIYIYKHLHINIYFYIYLHAYLYVYTIYIYGSHDLSLFSSCFWLEWLARTQILALKTRKSSATKVQWKDVLTSIWVVMSVRNQICNTLG